jgi:hypothetical protein
MVVLRDKTSREELAIPEIDFDLTVSQTVLEGCSVVMIYVYTSSGLSIRKQGDMKDSMRVYGWTRLQEKLRHITSAAGLSISHGP